MLLRYIPSLPAVLLFLLRGSRFWFWNTLFGEECLITCFDFLFLEYFIWWRMFDHLFGFFGFGIFYLMKNVWSPVWIFDFGIFYLVKNVWSPVLIFLFWNILFDDDHLRGTRSKLFRRSFNPTPSPRLSLAISSNLSEQFSKMNIQNKTVNLC